MARIVVVEDDGMLRSDLADHLRRWGHEVLEAVNGQEGFQAIKDHEPDLVLSDVTMPVESGFDLIRNLSEVGLKRTDLAFLFLTSAGSRTSEMFGLNAGADDYIVKPVDYDLLKARITSHLRKNRPPLHAMMLTWAFEGSCRVSSAVAMFAALLVMLGVGGSCYWLYLNALAG